MASYPRDFRFGGFVVSLIWLIFWILIIVALVGLPLIFIILFYVPLPEVDGEVLTPYLFLTSILYPQSAIPVIETLLDTTFFKVAVFPGFTYAALIAGSNNIHRAQVPCQDATQGWPTLCRQDRGYTTAAGRWPEAYIQRNNHSLRIRQTDLLVGSYSFCRNCCSQSWPLYRQRPGGLWLTLM